MSLAERLIHEAIATDEPAADEPAIVDATASGIADAALRQFELFGVTRSTIEEIARRAKLSRVTIYRRFPGKDALIEAVMLRELRRFLRDLDSAIEPLSDPDEMVVEGFAFTLQAVRSHRLLQRMLESEPEMLLPYLTVKGAQFVGAARDFLAKRIARERKDEHLDKELLTVAEIVVRLILSFLLTPQTPIDLDDPRAVRAFARRYLGPILAPVARGITPSSALG
jgi:AcrR family transcriptional regulator